MLKVINEETFKLQETMKHLQHFYQDLSLVPSVYQAIKT